MLILICPGIHPSHETDDFLAGLQQAGQLSEHDCVWIYPSLTQPAFSAPHIFRFLADRAQTLPHPTLLHDPSAGVRHSQPISVISFSAGVVGAIGAALTWHALGGGIQSFIAVDGWGVPLVAPFPVFRLSHDEFTHKSCQLIGGGRAGFWATPAVAHRQLWRSPHTTSGQVEHYANSWGSVPVQTRSTAAHFIGDCLRAIA